MKRVALALTGVLLAGCAGAQSAHDHSAPAPQAGGMGMHGGMGMPGMHEQMRKMRDDMARIRAATDPKEKERLMQEHMKTMEQAMGRMEGMGCKM
jgi:Spy/CpxP family protein refolding chaperone